MTVQAWQQTLERIQTEARQLDPAKVALTLIAVPFFVVGFVAATTVRVGWLAVSWAWTATLVGWRDAGGMRGRRPARGG